MSNVLAFPGFSQTISLDCLCQDQGRGPGVLNGRLITCMHFDGIVTPETHARQLLVRQMLYHLEQARVGAEEVLAEVRSALNKVFLKLSVRDFAHTPHQQAVPNTPNKRCPTRPT